MFQKIWKNNEEHRNRKGAIAVMAAAVMIMIFAFVSFTIDVGYMNLVRTELQNAADSAVLAGTPELSESHAAVKAMAIDVALKNTTGRSAVSLDPSDVVIGNFDHVTKIFTPGGPAANAVQVTTRATKPTFFGSVIGQPDFTLTASAIAMLNPRDIVFVVDLSGSMNDDTEPCWATETVDAAFAASPFPNPGTGLNE